MIPASSDLVYLVEVAKCLNLSRAAENLGISQPSITLAMARIEKAIGTPILLRHKRGVCLTTAGENLLVQTQQLLQQWDNIKSKTLASVHDIQGCFTIGCHPSVGSDFLPRFLGNLLRRYNKLEIKLQHDLSRKIVEQVINFKIEIGIAATPVKHPNLVIRELMKERLMLWRSSQEHNVHNLGSTSAVILCNPDLTQTQNILKELKRRNIYYGRVVCSNNLEIIANLTSSGCGIGILPSRVAERNNLIPIAKSPIHTDEICLLYRGENRNVRAIQVIIEEIKLAFIKHKASNNK